MPTIAPYSDLITDKELLDFSQNLNVARPAYLGSALLPDRKVQYLQAELSRLTQNGNLPMVAMVHALDTEAHIASRRPIDKIETEELLIKEKINVTERLRKVTGGMRMDNAKRFVFDDVARLSEMIITRAELAKVDALSRGSYTIQENGLDLSIDYGIPESNFVEGAWDEESDILGNIDSWMDIAIEQGYAPTLAITTRKVLARMKRNKAIQRAIFGNAGVGTLPSTQQLQALLAEQFDGFQVRTNDARYGVQADDGAITGKAFWPADKFVMVTPDANGAVGIGLWGVTPEEDAQDGAFDSRREQQFVTVTQWNAPDPVAHWTKASGLFVPVLPNPYGHIIADVSAPAASTAAEDGPDASDTEMVG